MKERIKELRKTLKLTQTDFGKKIGLTRDAIAGYERGVKISEPTIRLICREFNVDEIWLRTGVGSMLQEPATREEAITEYFADLVISKDEEKDFQKRFIRALSKLSIEDWKVLEKIAKDLVEDEKKG